MNSKIYLDNNATTQIDNDVFNAMLPYLKENYANPSSIYSFGREIRDEINLARNYIAQLLNVDFKNIIFTSGGSESNVTAIYSAIKKYPHKKHIITTKLEHTSVIETMKNIENNGYKITYLNVDKFGRINLEDLENSITDSTCLVCIMLANNEIGNIYPLKQISNIAHKHNILVHCDAVQAVGKINIDVKDLDVDFLSFSGHKIHAPKGIGVLYIKNNENFFPLVYGHQETNRRGGTENVPAIVGLGKSVKLIIDDNFNIEKEIEYLRDYMENKIRNEIDDIHIYGDLENRIPNTSSIAFKGVNAVELMLVLENYNIFVSTGSSCNSQIALPSDVLVACNADLNNYSPIRISLSKFNTKDEIDIFVKYLADTVKMLRKKGDNLCQQ